MKDRQIGILQVLLSGVLFGFLGVFGKKAFEFEIAPGELLALRYLIASVLMYIIIKARKSSPLSIGRKNISIGLLLGILGYAVFSSFYFYALQGISASLTVLLLYTYPLLVTLGAVLFLKESTNIWTYISLLVSFLGLVFLVWGEWSANSPYYILFGLGASFFYAIYILISRRFVKNVSPLKSSFFVQLGAGTTLGIFHFSNLERPFDLLASHSAFLICMAIICSVLPLTLFLAGLQKISSTEASVLSTTEPLFGVLIAFIVLQESLLNIQILGGVLVVGASVLMAIKSPKAKLKDIT